jgi:hypothetical protein
MTNLEIATFFNSIHPEMIEVVVSIFVEES